MILAREMGPEMLEPGEGEAKGSTLVDFGDKTDNILANKNSLDSESK